MKTRPYPRELIEAARTLWPGIRADAKVVPVRDGTALNVLLPSDPTRAQWTGEAEPVTTHTPPRVKRIELDAALLEADTNEPIARVGYSADVNVLAVRFVGAYAEEPHP